MAFLIFTPPSNGPSQTTTCGDTTLSILALAESANNPHIISSFADAPPARSEFQTPVGAKREETHV
jgi:hypothetical protein